MILSLLPKDIFFIVKRVGIVVFVLLSVSTGLIPSPQPKVAAYYSTFAQVITPTISPVEESETPQYFAVLSSEIRESLVPSPTPTPQWGKSRQIDEHTWTIDVGRDEKNATAQEIAAALNVYRKQKGKGELSWDSKLADYAQSRANGFSSSGKLDSHSGFQDFINNQDGFNKLGFFSLGENSSIGYHLSGQHLIEWVYAGDKPHDDNQLSSEWTHVGVGVSGDATDLIFGGRKQ